uniref:HGGxSTG domain-containing protein n=1 Tax=Orrella sp. TaxID=1921583 RepID=UPI004047F6A8
MILGKKNAAKSTTDGCCAQTEVISHPPFEPYITLAGGRIRCCRCQAYSKRTKQQCQSPSIKGKTKCRFHGGRSTGPKTLAGKERVAAAKTIHGHETRQIRKERQAGSLRLAKLEDLMYLLKMMKYPATKYKLF